MNEQDFYEKCAEILSVDQFGEAFPWPNYKRTRWNNRAPGRGRFPGFGIIRKFGDKFHVALTNPQHHGIYNTEEEVFDFLRSIQQC
jgi:hypothetical protein